MIMDGTDGFELSFIIHFKKNILMKRRKFRKDAIVYINISMKLKFLPKCLPITNNGITFQS